MSPSASSVSPSSSQLTIFDRKKIFGILIMNFDACNEKLMGKTPETKYVCRPFKIGIHFLRNPLARLRLRKECPQMTNFIFTMLLRERIATDTFCVRNHVGQKWQKTLFAAFMDKWTKFPPKTTGWIPSITVSIDSFMFTKRYSGTNGGLCTLVWSLDELILPRFALSNDGQNLFSNTFQTSSLILCRPILWCDTFWSIEKWYVVEMERVI